MRRIGRGHGARWCGRRIGGERGIWHGGRTPRRCVPTIGGGEEEGMWQRRADAPAVRPYHRRLEVALAGRGGGS
jgi:hypothetical protein